MNEGGNLFEEQPEIQAGEPVIGQNVEPPPGAAEDTDDEEKEPEPQKAPAAAQAAPGQEGQVKGETHI